jgi:hypothetical protein
MPRPKKHDKEEAELVDVTPDVAVIEPVPVAVTKEPEPWRPVGYTYRVFKPTELHFPKHTHTLEITFEDGRRQKYALDHNPITHDELDFYGGVLKK